MRNTKTTLIDKIEKMPIFRGQPIHVIAIISIIGVLSVFLIIALLIKLFAPQPRTYDDYFENIDQVMQVERDAADAAAVYQPLEEQLGTEFYENEVLGLDPRVAQVSESAVDVQIEAINNVQQNNAQVKAMGGISTPAELEQYYNGNPKDPVAASKVQQAIDASQGKF
ncbi:hypothetical protein ACTXIV_03065 [Psychrobacter celer]|uniref:hypothetical protein n=1 Tax=Psychrobacter celer TaxID=306572 RepID=UPI003FD10056